mmetsp:Transcript_26087/g.34244  ORF Transcript_26087/g.34244 Transcript_26087/m.34244 type:complete len:349 (-) Transcript_26087:358-1404(-)
MIDDSLPILQSVDTGAGRATTPQSIRQDGTATRFRSPLERGLHRSTTPQQAAPTPMHTAERNAPVRAKYHSKRKQRRWNNDHFFGMNLNDVTAEELMKNLSVSVEWRSNFSKLLSAPELEGARKKFLSGVGIEDIQTSGGTSPNRLEIMTDEQICEHMFGRVEKRLRTVVLKAVANEALAELMTALDTAICFWIEWKEPLPAPLPHVLFKALTGPLQSCQNNTKLAVPLGKSPFHRLLLHATCQYYGLHTLSTDMRYGRTVLVHCTSVPEGPFLMENFNFAKFLQRKHSGASLEEEPSAQSDQTVPVQTVQKDSEGEISDLADGGKKLCAFSDKNEESEWVFLAPETN